MRKHMRWQFLLHTLGPGILFAGGAVGVSHLVQATRAGAVYGLSLVLVVIAANIFKYPAFAFGTLYAAATGTSLLAGYRRRGRWALILYGVLTIGTMFTIQAAVAMVTSGLIKAVFAIESDVLLVSTALTAICIAIMAIGRYPWLDTIMKLVFAVLTVFTLIAAVLVVSSIDWSGMHLWPRAEEWTPDTIAMVAPLAGWMPSTVEASVWLSLWTVAKQKQSAHRPTVRGALVDFQIGYVTTAVLAIAFLLLGAGVIYGSGVEIASSSRAFAVQLISLYTATLGDWSYYLIGTCAVTVMFSTTLCVVDGIPRAMAALIEDLCTPEGHQTEHKRTGTVYWITMIVMAIGGLIIVANVVHIDFKLLIDIAAALAFVIAPILAFLNHRAVLADEVPVAYRPNLFMRSFSRLCIALLTLFAVWWLYRLLA